jgi:hypothetical protein
MVRGLIFSLFGILSILANAVLTAMFGYTFLHGVFGAVLLLLFFDAAAFAWFVVRLGQGLSGAQRATAKIMSVATIVGSTLVSVVQVLTVSEVMPTAGWMFSAAVWLVTAYGAANFFALFFFQNASIGERKTEQKEELAAQKADKLQEMITEAYNKAMSEATNMLLSRTPAVSRRIALQAEKDYLRDLDMLDLLEVPTLPDNVTTRQLDSGAAAGAIEVVRSKERKRRLSATPQEKAASSEACDCGLPLGTNEGECTEEVCLIDAKAAEEKAIREAAEMEPLDLTLPGK